MKFIFDRGMALNMKSLKKINLIIPFFKNLSAFYNLPLWFYMQSIVNGKTEWHCFDTSHWFL